jgi:hypothetical protein
MVGWGNPSLTLTRWTTSPTLWPRTFISSTNCGAGGRPDPVLRYGKTSWLGTFLDSWDGWGWRHTASKHGWSAADEGATRATLLSPRATIEQNATSMAYLGVPYDQNGAHCQRRVVVEFDAKTGDPPDTPKGVITSYAEPIP